MTLKIEAQLGERKQLMTILYIPVIRMLTILTKEVYTSVLVASII